MIQAFVNWKNWKAVKIVSGDCQLIVGISAGPRILSLSYRSGTNQLYEDSTGFGVGEWRLFGGHRFTIAPESEKSYYPDNELCKLAAAGSTVVVSSPVRTYAMAALATGSDLKSSLLAGNHKLRLSIEVSALPDKTGFQITHVLENCGADEWTGALWAITCLPHDAVITASCSTADIHYWPGTDRYNWVVSNDLMHVKTGDFRAKIGWHQDPGWLAASQTSGKLVIYNRDKTIAADCEDGGCNLELFVCKDWVELETLGCRTMLLPGQSARHVQDWVLSE
jgi:hypothetical protein